MTRRLTLLPGRYAVCQFDPADAGQLPAPPSGTGLWSLTRTANELSLVCPESDVPSGAAHVERGWRAFVVDGPIPFSETGVIAGLTSVLAANRISVFVVSTYDTDYILVPEAHVARAQTVLAG